MEFLAALAGGWAIVWTLVLFAIITATVEHELGTVSFIVLAVGLLVLEFTGTTALWAWASTNPLRLVGLAVLYLLAGCAWALIKWWLYVRKQKERVEKYFKYWRGMTRNEGVADSGFLDSDENPVQLNSENRNRIMIWMMWWVPSLFWTVVSDLVIGIWNRLYDLLAGGFAKIARGIVAGIIAK